MAVRTEIGKNIKNVYEDLISKKYTPDISYQTMLNDFYDIMRKYGIKQGVWTSRGSRITNTAEWIMCLNTFFDYHISAIKFQVLLNNNVPEDLLGYYKKEKKIKKPC